MASRAKPSPASADAKPARSKRGGARPGAGRPPGSKTKKSVAAAVRLLEGKLLDIEKGKPLPEGTTPLDVMIAAMRLAHEVGGPLAAFNYAKEAAPYMHPRMAPAEWRDPKNPNGGKMIGRFQVEFVRAQPAANDDEAAQDTAAAG